MQVLDKWKNGKPYALLACPAYQLPSSTSQIYQQAAERSVCILTYTHLAVLLRYAENNKDAKGLLRKLFDAVEAMPLSKRALDYWQVINRCMLEHKSCIRSLWKEEKEASVESIEVAKEESLEYLARERQRIMSLTKEQAIKEMLEASNIEGKVKAIKKVTDNGLLGMGM